MTATRDNRMCFLRENDRVNSGEDSYVTHYELISESYITGGLYDESALFGGNIEMRMLGESPYIKGLNVYRLTIRHPRPNNGAIEDTNASRDGYFSDEGPQGELMGLFSLFLNSRFYLTSVIHEELCHLSPYKFHFQPCSKNVAGFLFNEDKNFNHIAPKFSLIENFPGQYHQKFYFSIRFYSRALRLISIDKDVAYLNLVNAIETLLDYVDLGDEFERAEVEIREKIEKASFEASVQSELVAYLKQRKKGHKFLVFLKKYSSTSSPLFNNAPGKEHIYISYANFESHLKKIYQARSAYVHAGEPLHISSDSSRDWHLDGSLGQTWDQRQWEGSPLPRFFWFASLVRECLMKFLEEKAQLTI